MNARKSFYIEIHKGLRMLLADLVSKSGRTDYSDAAAVTRLRDELKGGIELLESHAHHESTFIVPMIEEKLPQLAVENTSAHEEQENDLLGLIAMIDRIDPRSPQAGALGHELNVELSRVAGDLMMHMAHEEQVIMPALWQHYTDEQIMATEQQLVGSIAPDKLARFLTWMIPAMNAPERAEMFAGMKAGAPAEVFAFVRDLARSVLTAEEDGALEHSLRAIA
jgi:hypothetical protein